MYTVVAIAFDKIDLAEVKQELEARGFFDFCERTGRGDLVKYMETPEAALWNQLHVDNEGDFMCGRSHETACETIAEFYQLVDEMKEKMDNEQ